MTGWSNLHAIKVGNTHMQKRGLSVMDTGQIIMFLTYYLHFYLPFGFRKKLTAFRREQSAPISGGGVYTIW